MSGVGNEHNARTNKLIIVDGLLFYIPQKKETTHTIGELVTNSVFFVGERERIWTICFGIVISFDFDNIISSRFLGLCPLVIVVIVVLFDV